MKNSGAGAFRRSPSLAAWGGAAVGFAALALAALADPRLEWLAAWATLVVGWTAVLTGPRVGMVAALAAGVLVWAAPGSDERFGLGSHTVAQWGALVLAASAGAIVRGRGTRDVEEESERARRARVLVDGAGSLGALADERSVLEALPPILARVVAFEHATVLEPIDDAIEVVATTTSTVDVGLRIPTTSISGRTLRTGVAQHVPDTRLDLDYHRLGRSEAARSEYAVPIVVQGRAVAVVNVERLGIGGFTAAERETVDALVQIAEAHLGRLRTLAAAQRARQEAELLGDLASKLSATIDPAHAASLALDRVVEVLGLEGGVVYTLQRGRFVGIASTDLPPHLANVVREGIPWSSGRIRSAWTRGAPAYIVDYAAEAPAESYRQLGLRGLAFVPLVGRSGSTIAMLEVGMTSRPHAWSASDRRLLEAVADTLGGALARATEYARTQTLLEVVRRMSRSDDVDELYQRVVDAALAMAPGAEAASLQVRKQGEEGFTFAAVVGFPLDDLRSGGAIPYAQQVAWYGDGEVAMLEGKTRLRASDEVQSTAVVAQAASLNAEVLKNEGKIDQIRANLCSPIVFAGELVAVLNVDAFACEAAFEGDATLWADALAQHVATIVRLAHDRDALARSALTDPLTGVGNREAFNRTVTSELARAQRYTQPLALVMIDLNGFKPINDQLGHEAGDRALIDVATTLVETSRDSDTVFRWGGDEFAVVMPMTDAHRGREAAMRFSDAISRVHVGGLRLGASVGLAYFPDDGPDAESLMRRADDLMYASKRART